jgi:hypothetical protein
VKLNVEYPSWLTPRRARRVYAAFVVVVLIVSAVITTLEVTIAESLQRHVGFVPGVVGCVALFFLILWFASRLED